MWRVTTPRRYIRDGGSILGTSRGGSDTADIVDSIADMELDFLFVIGGNGSHAGALAIDNMCKARGMCTAVIGIPKTIDNDILLLDRTFGFQTAGFGACVDRIKGVRGV
jgi:6-phosphofructokinase 1